MGRQVLEGLAIGTTLLSKESSGWVWNGERRWWQVFTTITGYNGLGGYWAREEWRWNRNDETLYTAIVSLSVEESRALEAVARQSEDGPGKLSMKDPGPPSASTGGGHPSERP